MLISAVNPAPLELRVAMGERVGGAGSGRWERVGLPRSGALYHEEDLGRSYSRVVQAGRVGRISTEE